MNLDLLKASLRLHEGVKAKPYQDSVGKWTIGVGRNLSDKGLSNAEIEDLLQNDCTEVLLNVGKLSCWHGLSDIRQRVIAEMCFQLGFAELQRFKKMFAAIDEGNFADAADEMLNSEWANQTHGRAFALSQMMRLNQDV